MKPDIKHKRCGIYCIKNMINNKVYIGKSKNIYFRIYQHLYDLKNKRTQNENQYLLNSWYKYGENNFEYSILEYLELNDDLVKEREIYWMKKYNSLNRNYGYNLRQDSSTNMIIHEETSKKISERLKKEWSEGIRSNHSKKLSDNWKTTPERNKIQSEFLSNLKTKYKYLIYDLDNNFIKEGLYKELKELNIHGVQHKLARYKVNEICFKGFYIKRVKIEDIVRSLEKSKTN